MRWPRSTGSLRGSIIGGNTFLYGGFPAGEGLVKLM
jgi:hypothetical protein